MHGPRPICPHLARMDRGHRWSARLVAEPTRGYGEPSTFWSARSSIGASDRANVAVKWWSSR